MRNTYVKYSQKASAILWFCTANKFKSSKLYFRTSSISSEVGGAGSMFLTGKTDILTAIIFWEGDEGIVLELMLLLDMSMHLFSVTFKICVLSSRSTGWRDSREKSFPGQKRPLRGNDAPAEHNPGTSTQHAPSALQILLNEFH